MLCKFESVLPVFMMAKKCHQDFNLICTIIFVIHHPFEQKCFTQSLMGDY
jgi:hypothetical protein